LSLEGLLNGILNFFTFVIFARVILSFIVPLMGARPHPIVISIASLVNQITEPILGPIRRILPSFGGMDFSPMVVLIILILLGEVVKAAL
jgi:YggT family protein